MFIAFGVTGAPNIDLGDLKFSLEGQQDGSVVKGLAAKPELGTHVVALTPTRQAFASSASLHHVVSCRKCLFSVHSCHMLSYWHCLLSLKELLVALHGPGFVKT